MRDRRFTKGEPIRDLATLVRLIQANRWVFWGKAPKHPGFLLSMTLHTLASGVRGGLVSYAIDKKEGSHP